MTNKSFPRMGKSHLLKSVREIVEAIRFGGPMSKEELLNEMERINSEHESQVYIQQDEEYPAFKFLTSEERWLQVISPNEEGKYELTETGERLVNARDFEHELFDLLEERSRTQFTDYHEILEAMSRRMENGRLELGTSRNSEFESMMTEPNSYSASLTANFLKEFGVIRKDGRIWVIDPERFAELRRNDEEMAIGVLQQHKGRMASDEFREYLQDELGWTHSRVEQTIAVLEENRRIEHQRAEGTDWITSKG